MVLYYRKHALLLAHYRLLMTDREWLARHVSMRDDRIKLATHAARRPRVGCTWQQRRAAGSAIWHAKGQRLKDGRRTCDVSSLVGDTEVHKVQERIDVTLTHARYK